MPATVGNAEAGAPSFRDMANAIRALAMDGVEKAKSGHPGMPMGMADVATALFTKVLKYDAADPAWPDRDRFVLSAGHGSMLLYALLHLIGEKSLPMSELARFRALGSRTPGHPEHGHTPGVETTTGPLGQGLANAVGMALAERLLNARLGDGIVDHRTYCIAGDGCLMEGLSHEAISLAGHLRLNKLVVLFDDNAISIDGPTDLAVSDDQVRRFEAAGWRAERVDGHDREAILAALERAKASDRPSLIACKTLIGFGSPGKQGKASAHGEPLGEAEIKATREKLGWPHAPFTVPAPIAEAWRAAGNRGAVERAAWMKRAAALPEASRRLLAGPTAADIDKAVATMKPAIAADTAKRATRVWSQLVIEQLVPAIPSLIGGSADLTGSNGTRTKHHKPVKPGEFSGNYIHYGVREHAMAAAMNGMALHGGIVPYGGTFLVFTDYCRPSIRLSALMRQRVIYVMTHDSIGLGEDGPTHQPVEHLAALRAMPNVVVLRPADGIETAECWEIALRREHGPTILALTRQALPNVRKGASAECLAARGAYVLSEPAGGRDVTLIATGSEIGLAVDAAAALGQKGVKAAVVSMPSFELFRDQSDDYRGSVLGKAPRVGIEAGVRQGWQEWLRRTDVFVGLSDYGASGPYLEVYKHFGLSVEAIVAAAGKASSVT